MIRIAKLNRVLLLMAVLLAAIFSAPFAIRVLKKISAGICLFVDVAHLNALWSITLSKQSSATCQKEEREFQKTHVHLFVERG